MMLSTSLPPAVLIITFFTVWLSIPFAVTLFARWLPLRALKRALIRLDEAITRVDGEANPTIAIFIRSKLVENSQYVDYFAGSRLSSFVQSLSAQGDVADAWAKPLYGSFPWTRPKTHIYVAAENETYTFMGRPPRWLVESLRAVTQS